MAHGEGARGHPASGQPLLSAPPAPLLLPGAWHPLPHTLPWVRSPGSRSSTVPAQPWGLQQSWRGAARPGHGASSRTCSEHPPGARLSITGVPQPFPRSPALGALLGPTGILLHSTRGAPQWDMRWSRAGKRWVQEEVVPFGTAPLALVTAMPAVCPGQWGLGRGAWGQCVSHT